MSAKADKPHPPGAGARVAHPEWFTGATVVLSLAICFAMAWLHFRQHQEMVNAVNAVGRLRQARVDLTRGFLAVTNANVPELGYDEDDGLALLTQAARAIADASGSDGEQRPARQEAEALMRQVNAWRAAKAHSPKEDIELRIAYHRLEQRADDLDADVLEQERRISATQDRIYLAAVVLAAIFLTAVSLLVLASGRAREVAEQVRAAAVAEARRLNERLARKVQELETLFEVLPIGIAIADDPECSTVRTNRQMAAQLGLAIGDNASLGHLATGEEPPYRCFRAGRELALPEYPLRWSIANRAEVRGTECEVVRRDGTSYSQIAYTSPLFDDEGAVCGCVGAFVDISERKATELALEASEHRLRLVTDTVEVGLVVVDHEHRYRYANRAYPKIMRLGAIDLLGRRVADVLGPAYGAILKARLERGFAGERQTYEWAWPASQPDEPSRYYLASMEPAVENGEPMVVVVVAEVTERKRQEEELRRLNAELETRVQQRTAELENSNRELEAFSYSVSHDLRAPLRHINGFSQALMEDHQEELSDGARGYLNQIITASRDMGRLIDDLLALSRVTRTEMTMEPVDLTAEAERILESLHEHEPDRAVRATVESGMAVRGDRALLRIMLDNLIGNAWKFTSRTTEAAIVIGIDGGAEQPRFFVRDNGAGFDMAYASKLFKPFQRLHKTSQFEGTGIGLATVQRIVNRHGGAVWTEAAPGQGATFYFTLAAPEKTANGG